MTEIEMSKMPSQLVSICQLIRAPTVADARLKSAMFVRVGADVVVRVRRFRRRSPMIPSTRRPRYRFPLSSRRRSGPDSWSNPFWK